MLIPTIVVALLTLVLAWVVYQRGEGEQWVAIKDGGLQIIKIFPILAFAIIMAEFMKILLPQELIMNWLGPTSGAKGLWIGTAIGVIMPPGGVVVLYGIVGGMLKAGAGMGVMVALITSYNLMALHRLPFEISFLGWRFTLLRFSAVLFLPPIAGFLADMIKRLADKLT